MEDFSKLSDEELDAKLSETQNASTPSVSVEDMSDEELDAKLKASEVRSEPAKLSWPEKIADTVTGGMISEGKKIQAEAASGSQGKDAQSLSKGLRGIEDTAKTVGEIGQSIVLTNAAGKVLQTVPFLQKQKVIQSLVSSVEQKAAARGIRITNIQRAIQRQVIEGAVAVQPFDYKDIGDRIKATAISAAISPLIGVSVDAGIGLATRIARNYRKFTSAVQGGLKETFVGTLRDPRLPPITQVREELASVEKEGREIGQSSRQQIVEAQNQGRQEMAAVDDRASSVSSKISSEIDAEKNQMKQSLNETKRQINKSITDTSKALNTESDIAAKTFQSKATSFFRENSDMYGKELDSVSDAIAKTGRMTVSEAFSVLDNTVTRSAQEAEVVEGSIIDKVKNLMNKYKEEVKVIPDSGGKVVARDMNELINFKDFLGEVRSIWKDAKAYRKGNARFSQEEIPAAILQSEFGELVSRLPGGESFQDLQSAYRPVISYMNKASSVLKPYLGEAYTKTAELLVKQYAKGTSSEADKQLIQFVENGTERFAKGMGSVTARARQLGENMRVLKTQMAKMGIQSEKEILRIAEEGAMKLSRVDVASKDASRIIQKETEKRTAMIMQEAARAEMKNWQRANTLRGRENLIRSLNEKNSMIKRLAIGVTTVLGGLTSAYVVTRGAREIVNTIGKND